MKPWSSGLVTLVLVGGGGDPMGIAARLDLMTAAKGNKPLERALMEASIEPMRVEPREGMWVLKFAVNAAGQVRIRIPDLA